jgi:hypothetical protein
MSQTLVMSDPNGRVRREPPEFGCTLRDSGVDAAWVRVVRELDVATAPQLEQTFAPCRDSAAGCAGPSPARVHELF